MTLGAFWDGGPRLAWDTNSCSILSGDDEIKYFAPPTAVGSSRKRQCESLRLVGLACRSLVLLRTGRSSEGGGEGWSGVLPSSVEHGDSFRSFSVEGMVVPSEGFRRSCLSRYRAGDSGIVIVIATVIGGSAGWRDGQEEVWVGGR
jgi:hypothetical protein